jgi:ABC-type multidrug transport system fused ATPase/permease subunit
LIFYVERKNAQVGEVALRPVGIEPIFDHTYFMKSPFITLLVLLAALTGSAQSTNLTDRFQQLKEKSQTFKDYKVIKEATLDAFWKSVEDTLMKRENVIASNQEEIRSVKHKMATAEAEVKQREEAVQEIIFDSNHISIVGISFHKALFISVVLITLGALVFLFVASVLRSQLMQRSLKEKAEALLILNSEFEEYKHRAVEKQMKLSRELQNERNMLAELRTTR